MASITYKSLSSLRPIELKYSFYRDENLNNTLTSLQNGLTLLTNNSFIGFRDTTINRESAFVLTDAVDLHQAFASPIGKTFGEVPGTVTIEPRTAVNYYAAYNSTTNNITLSTTADKFNVIPTNIKNVVEIYVNGRFLQVDEKYPYTITTNLYSLPEESIHRQRFEFVYQNNTITLKTKTKDGFRYIAFGEDNILRATGLLLNDLIFNDYVFNVVVTNNSSSINFNPTNTWVTYYQDLYSEANNKNVKIKDDYNVQTNLLVNFEIDNAVKQGKAYLNIANLKTGVTPFGGPAPVSNLLNK